MTVLDVTLKDFHDKFTKDSGLWLYDGREVYSVSDSLLNPPSIIVARNGCTISFLKDTYGPYCYYTYSTSSGRDIPYRNVHNWGTAISIAIDLSLYSGTITLKDVTNEPYSSDCPYSYRLYYDSNIKPRLSILKNSTSVFDERIRSLYGRSVDITSDNAIYYAETKLKEYVDKCKANLKIKTTCCLLVCCEPDKYKLI